MNEVHKRVYKNVPLGAKIEGNPAVEAAFREWCRRRQITVAVRDETLKAKPRSLREAKAAAAYTIDLRRESKRAENEGCDTGKDA
jgi:hypothetical protein